MLCYPTIRRTIRTLDGPAAVKPARPATVGATVRAIERNMRRNAGNFKEPETSRKEPERKGEAGRNRGKSGKAEAQGWRPAPPRSASGSSGLRSEARRVGNECVSPCRSRWSPDH